MSISPESKKAKDKIIEARVSLIINQAFFGSLAIRLIIIDASEWIPTAATDGRYFYYNVDFINSLDKKELEFLFAHEVMHCCYDHMSRRGSREAQLWNQAADYVINLELVEMGIGKLIHRPGKVEPCYDTKYSGMYSEEVYELLVKEYEKMKDKYNTGNFDVHLTPGSGEGEEGEDGKSSSQIYISEEEAAMLREEIKQEIIRTAKMCAGSVPAGVKRLIDEITCPKIDWREYVAKEVKSMMKSDYSFMKPSKKSWATGGITLPGMMTDYKAVIGVAIDMSGSIGQQQARDFLGEINGILDQFNDFEMDVWCFDTKTYNHMKFTPENKYDIEEYQLMGGGGTSFEVNWEFMKENDINPNKFIMFTDGCPGDGWGDDMYCDTIFLVHGNPSVTAPFGITAHYEEF
jgi:predicted metal-dependent peptidase